MYGGPGTAEPEIEATSSPFETPMLEPGSCRTYQKLVSTVGPLNVSVNPGPGIVDTVDSGPPADGIE